GREPELARSALARRLAGQVVRDPGDLAKRAGTVAERQYDAGPEGAARRREPFPADRDLVGGLGVEPHAVVAADEHSVARGRLADVEDGPERDTSRAFRDRRVLSRSAHAKQH